MPVPRGDLTRSAVLAALGTSGPLSRTDIARVLGVSPATVTQIVKDLLARGLVAEVEHRPSRGGRPAVLLGLVGSAGRALGAKVAADHVAVVDVRLDGQVRQSWEWPFDAMAADAPDRLVDLLRPLLETSGTLPHGGNAASSAENSAASAGTAVVGATSATGGASPGGAVDATSATGAASSSGAIDPTSATGAASPGGAIDATSATDAAISIAGAASAGSTASAATIAGGAIPNETETPTSAPDDAAPILGVGIGVPGAVDDQETGAVDAPTLGWQHLPLGARLREALPVPVLVENDVNALAVAERLYGRGREHRNFLVVTIGRGVGAGLVVDGAVYRGTNGGAGEFGHFPVRAGGPACSCGNTGCLEAAVGQEALLRAARRAGLTKNTATLTDLQQLADAGSNTVKAIFADAGEQLGRGVAGLINVMDPEIVIVLGEGTRAWEHWRPGFEPSLRAHLMPSRRGVPVVVESWDDTSWALGAAALVLATPYDAAGATGGQGELVRARLGGALAGELS